MQDASDHIKVPGNIAAEASTFLKELQCTLKNSKGSKISLDVSEVSQSGSLCVQALVFAARICAEHGTLCCLDHAPDSLKKALHDCGVCNLFSEVKEA